MTGWANIQIVAVVDRVHLPFRSDYFRLSGIQSQQTPYFCFWRDLKFCLSQFKFCGSILIANFDQSDTRQLKLKLIILVLAWCFSLESSADVELYGFKKQGGHLFGRVEPGTQVLLNGQLVPVLDNGHFVIGLGRDAKLTHEIQYRLKDQSTTAEIITLEARKYNVQHIKGVPSRTVTPPQSALKRIEQEAAKVKKSRSKISQLQGFMQPFIWPVFGRISGVYGSARSYNGKEGRPHFGIDIAAPQGEPVYAPANGTIVMADDDLFYSGGTIILDHGLGLSSTMIHLSKVLVEEGQSVTQGEVIGLVGSTGRSTGPHLDWRMNWGQERIDPAYFVPNQKDLCQWNLPTSKKGLVIVLHGLGRTPFSMNTMAGQLNIEGYSVCNQGYPSRKQSLEVLSSYVANAIAKAERNGVENIHFVTHSMGGILLRYYLQHQDLPEGSRIVMLAPPNKGSEVIDKMGQWIWFSRLMGPAAMQLSTGKQSMPNRMRGVDAQIGVIAGKNSSDPWFNWLFNGEHDGKVSVESAQLNEMTDFIVVPRGHTMIMRDSLVQTQTAYFLQNGRFLSDDELGL